MTVEELSSNLSLEQATLPFSSHLLNQKEQEGVGKSRSSSVLSGEEREEEMTEGVQPKRAYR